MLRLTINKSNNKVIKELDFKQDNLSENPFIERKESLPITYEDDEAVNSIIDFLNYKKSVELVRKRHVYEKNNIKFEIDEYISPEVSLVVSFEGEKDIIDAIYQELKEKYSEFFIIKKD